MNKKEGNQVSAEVQAANREALNKIAAQKNKDRIALAKKKGEKYPNRLVKGQVLNPGGKKRGVKNFSTVLNTMLDQQKVEYWDDARKKMIRIPKRSAAAQKILDNALMDDKIEWMKLLINTTEPKADKETEKPVINVNIANFKDMSIEDLLNTAGNPNDTTERV